MTILKELQEAASTAVDADARKRRLICRALERGIPSRAVAEAAGLSHQGVLKIWRREAEKG